MRHALIGLFFKYMQNLETRNWQKLLTTLGRCWMLQGLICAKSNWSGLPSRHVFITSELVTFALKFMAVTALILHSTYLFSFKPMNKANWKDVFVKYGKEFPNLLSVVDLVLTIPAHSVECERGFSQMKKAKTDWRSSLATDTLTCIMRINLQSPSENEFDPDPAISLWNTAAKRGRRPFQPPYTQRGHDDEAVDDDDGDNDDEYMYDEDGDEDDDDSADQMVIELTD